MDKGRGSFNYEMLFNELITLVVSFLSPDLQNYIVKIRDQQAKGNNVSEFIKEMEQIKEEHYFKRDGSRSLLLTLYTTTIEGIQLREAVQSIY